ncbi:unnamed protein product [Darwinula stevensoni]|uniref:Uncharacterized protein n=1 Tax=Darwinula stevensoni TaxID=69355 RepID=A0A7R9ACR0_9CRUS|nr:unnamed protein product [Darwinula stevensoni]CAG0900558.1 unnamed protein product [Darwinula stevensoni]
MWGLCNNNCSAQGLTLAVSNLLYGLLAPEALYMCTKPIFQVVMVVTWVMCLGSLLDSLGSWQVPIFIVTVIFLILGAVSEALSGKNVKSPMKNILNQEKEHLGVKELRLESSILQASVGGQSSPVSNVIQSTPIFSGLTKLILESPLILVSPLGPNKQTISMDGEGGNPSPFLTDKDEGDSYIVGVVWAAILIQLYKYPWLLQLIPIPLAYYLIRKAGGSTVAIENGTH